MIRGSSCGTWPRSGMLPVPGRPAGDRPGSVTSNITSRMKRVAERVCVIRVLSAGMSTGSSRIPGGRSSRSPRAPSAGPPRLDVNTPPNQPDTRSNEGEPVGRGSASPNASYQIPIAASDRVACVLTGRPRRSEDSRMKRRGGFSRPLDKAVIEPERDESSHRLRSFSTGARSEGDGNRQSRHHASNFKFADRWRQTSNVA